jgi:hypothetical protein
MLSNIYLGLGISLLAFYSLASYLGWELGTAARESAQAASHRHSSGGARSHWYTGFRGGK